ncbi:hypothetical protein ACIQZD_25605 [Peribacillus sp. NPDC096447]|uniref:hypothetical protein n=1 Tax=Peribacillus sp. NPDC096447 TaxID=3364394 RepID=UPI00382D2BB8
MAKILYERPSLFYILYRFIGKPAYYCLCTSRSGSGESLIGFKYHLFNYSGVVYDAIIKKYWVNC